MILYFDTSVVVAAVVAQHPHHAVSVEVLNRLAGHRGVIAAHGITEIFSVITRMPTRPRIDPHTCWQMIEAAVLDRLELVALDALEYRAVVERCSRRGWAGGKVHDAIHLACAAKAGAERIYTHNLQDFRTLALDEEQRSRVVSP